MEEGLGYEQEERLHLLPQYHYVPLQVLQYLVTDKRVVHVKREQVEHLLEHLHEAFLHHRGDLLLEALGEHVDELQQPAYLVLVLLLRLAQSLYKGVHDPSDEGAAGLVVQFLLGGEEAHDGVEEEQVVVGDQVVLRRTRLHQCDHLQCRLYYCFCLVKQGKLHFLHEAEHQVAGAGGQLGLVGEHGLVRVEHGYDLLCESCFHCVESGVAYNNFEEHELHYLVLVGEEVSLEDEVEDGQVLLLQLWLVSLELRDRLVQVVH